MSAAWARLRRVGVGGGGELDLGGDFGPAAVAVDAAVGARRAEDGVAGEGYVVDGFDEGVEGGVQTFAALEEQAGGAGVTVDGAVVVELLRPERASRGRASGRIPLRWFRDRGGGR